MMYGYHGGFGGWAGMILGGLFFLLIVAGLVAFIVMAVRVGRRGGGMHYYGPPMPGGGPGPKDILQARFAKGEITKEQYREMLAEIDH